MRTGPSLPILVLLVAALPCAPAAAADTVDGAERPNVVLIMTDDQGAGDFGATGNPVIETPQIDALAARSVLFDTFYVSPVCSPTRACLMTGRYNYRTRVIDTYIGRSMMDPAEVTLAEALGAGGYATGIFGKWHLGDNYPMRPQDQGFDEVLVLRGGGLGQPSDPRENHGRYTNPILFHNGEQVRTEGYCTDVYFSAAAEFIEQQTAAEQPFFAYIATNAPHGPFNDVPEELYQHYLGKKDALADLAVGAPANAKQVDTLARIAAMITNIDQNVGRLVDRLRELGQLDNTLILVMVDNGPNTRRYVGPLRGMKSDIQDGGIRSPLWMHWPAGLGDARTIHTPAAHIDVMPTVLELCGVAPPAQVELDGRSLAPLLADADAAWPDRTLTLQTHRGDTPQRYHHFMIRDSRWKLAHPTGFGGADYGDEPDFELYDLENDPGETNDLADERPAIVDRLRTAYDAWFDDVSSTRLDNYAPPRIVVGSEHENPSVLTRQDWRGGEWRRNSIGHWLLNVAGDGVYDVRVEFDKATEAETLVLEIGDQTRKTDVETGADTAEFEGVDLPAGDTRLEGVLTGASGKRGVHQVELRKR